jgi:hypothetical protein
VRGVALLILLAAPLAFSGCATPPAAPPAADLQWPPMTVRPANAAATELAASYHLAWREGRFGVLSEGAQGLPVHAVVEGPVLSTSTLGQSWVRWSLAEFQAVHPMAIRYTLWDLPRLLDATPDSTQVDGLFLARLDLDRTGDRETTVELRQEAGRIVWARVATPLDAGSPFTFEREEPRPFPMVPSPALEEGPVLDGDTRALQGHEVLLGWVRDHQALLGSLPATIAPDSLLLQSFNREWPKSPYDGKPMANQDQEGHFLWHRCSANDASFTGLGWDGAVLMESFGQGCSRGRAPET